LFVLLTVALNAQSSKKIEILNADNTFANSNQHPDYWRLISNVSFKHNDVIMHCDSAYHYINKDKMKAFGKIKITKGDSIFLTGSNMIYFGLENKANIYGGVVLIDKYITLKTEKIFYNFNTNIASYPLPGEIIDNEKTINSKKGEYNSSINNFIFKDSVKVVAKDYNILTDNMHYNSNSETTYFFGPTYIISENKTIYCENGWYNTKTNISQLRDNTNIVTQGYILRSDSLYYNMNLGYAKAIKNVELIDTVENLTVLGNIAEYYEKKKVIEMTQSPILQILFDNDTLFMNADKFISHQEFGEKKIVAFNKVKFFKTDLQGKCDSLSYSFSDSIVEMFNRPVLWSHEFQLLADSIKFLIHKGNISNMFLRSSPIIISVKDSLDFNQIKGRSMTANFTENKISRMDVKGNGQSIFIVTDEATNDKIGLNYTECSNLSLFFKKNKLEIINYEINPYSITTPYEDLNEEDRFLDGFDWRGSERFKSKEDIFTE
jgi:lipopolysaccharide export system protein LptA